ncbi:Por secretion system C-terminal sorting domain-containing protein [Flavobacterium swingsii]|jgi:aminopeptidase YwaD|uniref:Por secretion system C-terminal sorting domain-containing protein n=1 Tax=Flavobacterium swingsii TaxID=498292 RepID=A0A1I0ZHX4_9FLAO|nr:M28 family peptidase [Flavobacterium swingsii]SFB23813.1 Por secretion system C-terminal sorting domain-containing protein [Flavobacterium swingsii]
MKTTAQKFIIIFLFTINGLFAQTFVQAYADIANQVSQTNVTNNLIEYENLGVKRRGTPELQNTLDWLKLKYSSYGYTASQIVEDTYSYSGFTCKNLTVNKIGTVYPNIFVIVCGHYDSISGTGTNDNGSGVVTILEIARLLQNVPTEYSIKFVNFSGEEDGLKGSQAYVSNVVNASTPLNIKLVFNLDEVGGVAGMTNNNITCERDTASPTTNNAASTAFTNEMITCVGLYSPLSTTLSYAYASDYMSFQSNNNIITGMFETNETTHKHTATDLLVNMDPVYNYKVAKAATGTMLHYAVASTTLSNKEFNSDFQVSFFPNPTKDSININIGTLTEKEYQFSLIDINGKVVLEKMITNPNQIERINISSLTKGIYLATLNVGKKKISKKIVIE